MGKRGPKTAPTNLKMLKGNPGKRDLPENEPTPTPIAPEPPAWLNDEAREIWEDLARRLERCGLLTTVDGPKFAALCHVLSQYIKYAQLETASTDAAITSIGEKDTDGRYTQRQSYYTVARNYLNDFNRLAADFGLSPADRAGLASNPIGGQGDKDGILD